MKNRNYVLLIVLVTGLSLATQLPALAATYYVAPNGNDSRSSAEAQNSSTPWKTLAKAVSVAVAGDIVNFAAGTYPETATVFFSNSGTSTNPITFNGTGTTIIKCNIRINGNFIVVNGITVSPAFYVAWEAVRLNGQNITLNNCTVTNYNACAGNQAVAITFGESGAFNTVQNCTIRDLDDIDVFHVWGHDQVIRNCFVTNVHGPHYDGNPAPCGGTNHTDFFQTWGWQGVAAYNILVEGCTVVDCAIQLGNTSTDNQPGLHDITFRNNIFANVAAAFFTGVPNTNFFNNVFYNVGDAQGYAVSFYNQNYYSSAGSQFKNNVFLANIADIHNHNGVNNVTIANNYFANANYSAKTNGEPMGSNFINGGDPKFINVAGLDFHLLTGSPLINAGATLSPVFPDRDGNARNGNWDIGVDELGGSDTQAPTVPAGLTSTDKTQTSFALSWTASTDNVGVTGYEVFKDGVSIGTTTTTSMSVTGLSANTTYSMTVRARDAVPNWSAQSTALNVTTLAVGEIASSTTWQSFPISTQTGIFTAEFDAKPNTAGMDGVVGVLNGTATGYSDNACSVRFNTGNTIDALNGSAYGSATTVNYTPGTSYHFRLVINIPNHTYSIYVTPQGQGEITLGTNYAFRTQQASVTQLTGWSLYASSGTHTVSNVTFSLNDTQAPTVPAGLTSTDKTQTGFTLIWTASTDNVGVTGYEVFKDGVSIGTTTTTSMSVTDLSANTTYSMTVRARDAVPNWSAQSSPLNVTTLPAGVTSSTSWQSFQISTQTQTFVAEFDAVPNSAEMNGVVGIVNGTAGAYADNACTVRFHESNTIQALNGSAYSSATTVNYTAGNSYHFRLVINIPNHTYSIYVTPQGQSEITLGTNYAFRTQQASVTQLTGWALLAEIGTHTVSNMSFSPVSGTVWQSFPVSTQTGVFTAEYDAVPNTAAMDGVVGILNGTATGYVDNACSIRFNPGNTIDALNGSAYNAAATVNYTPGASYHFRLVINVPNHTYSIYVTPPGQSEIALGTNYAFRTQQASVTQLTGWSLLSTNGTHTVSNVVFTSGSGRTRTSGDVASKAITLPYLGDKDAGVFNAEGKALIVYPNPTQSSLKIRMLSEPGKIQQISIYNSDGKEIVRRTIDSAEETIDTSSLPSGTYLIKLVSGNRLTVERFIVQH